MISGLSDCQDFSLFGWSFRLGGCFGAICGAGLRRAILAFGCMGSRAWSARWRTMVCSVKTRAFKNNTNRRVHLAQRLLAALGAPVQRELAKFLGAFKLHTAVLAPIRINRHSYIPQLAVTTFGHLRPECILRLFRSNRKISGCHSLRSGAHNSRVQTAPYAFLLFRPTDGSSVRYWNATDALTQSFKRKDCNVVR